MRPNEIAPAAEDELPPQSLEQIEQSLARSAADAAAGRVVSGESLLAELRAMIEDYETRQRHGAADR